MRVMNPESTQPQTDEAPHPPLVRPREGGMLTGTAAGIAAHLDMDPTLVRVLFLVLAVMGGSGIALYLAAWLLIPQEGAERPIAADLIEHARFTFGRVS